ncbi:MAG: RHS repeat-associated core domain-containing protein [Candidatus Altiarchaeota archaeon]
MTKPDKRNMKAAYAVFASFLVLSISVTTSTAVSVDFSYDANGNLLSDGEFYYEYDDANQLSRVCQDQACSTVVAQYGYDHTGNRVKKVEGGHTTYYIGEHYEETDGQGTSYYFANGERVAKKNSTGIYYYLKDHLGSTSVITDAAGQEIARQSYTPFGETIDNAINKYLYTDQEYDIESGLYYYGARYYNPTIKRFTQPDTIIQDPYDPQTLNRYSYVRNNPLKYTDPSGNCAWDACVVEGSAGGIIITVATLVGLGYGVIDYITTEPSQRSVAKTGIKTLGAIAGGSAAGIAGTITFIQSGGNVEATNLVAVSTYSVVKGGIESMFTSKNPLKPKDAMGAITSNFEETYLSSQVFGPPGVLATTSNQDITNPVVEGITKETIWTISSEYKIGENSCTAQVEEDTENPNPMEEKP